MIALHWFFPFELFQPSKFTYNSWHPYLSWVTIIAFVILGNGDATLRSASSQMFRFIGRCSFEAFMIQHHL